ncbi:MAG: hypothetical protein JO091_13020 [Acidobacteriaceae bacterium]|nr:hypothetical protein [Acidobacteriaceae bacterium]
MANRDNAKFCSNCGTQFDAASSQWQTPYRPQPPQASPAGGQNSTLRNIALGCGIVLLIFILFGLSCTRACFGRRRYYRRYGNVVQHIAMNTSSAESSRQSSAVMALPQRPG